MIAPVYIVAALARATPNDPQIICSVSGSVVACCLISASKDRMQSAIAAIANTGSVTFSANSFSELEEEFSASEKNMLINNIDAVIVCEKPKISDYSDLMQKNIARILNINPKRISIKGKTSESIGFIGRQEGIAAMVNTSIRMIDDILDD